MAARRVRIKGIANIPVRRKNDTPSDKLNDDIKPTCAEEEPTNDIKGKKETSNDVNEISTTNVSHFSDESENKSEKSDTRILHQNTSIINKARKITFDNIDAEKSNVSTNEQNESISQSENKLSRRWASRPSVRIPSIPRKIKTTTSEPTPEKNDKIVTDVTTNEKDIDAENNLTNSDTIIKLSDKHEDSNVGLLSPNKTVNRARIRPVPRFIRRTSVHGSASESEDESRKTQNRIRNDSVSSISNIDGPIKEDVTGKPIRISSYKKLKYTDQSRKLATARREFQLKFGSECPDRRKLTMMDLIFYNPTTNPMPEKPSKKKTAEIIEKLPSNVEEESVDDPQKSDTEEPPVPQVKVGPDGEIILDEQSLVIEQTGAKRAREQMENTQIIIDDLDTGYGIYKRPKRCKDWSFAETLRFYRTLNTVGTDFSLMLSLFPGRTRRDLKMKFKKEERNNRMLVDKVLMNPLNFNLTELETQLQDDQNNDLFKIKKPVPDDATAKKKPKYYKSSVLSREICDENETVVKKKRTKNKENEEKPKNKLYRTLQKGLEGLIDESESEDDVLTINDIKINNTSHRPTRKCRLKNQNNYDATLDSEDSEIEEINLVEEDDENPLNEIHKIRKKNPIQRKSTNITSTYNINHLKYNAIDKDNNEISLEDEDYVEAEEPAIETNIVIAHSENEEPDKILIDILSKNPDEKDIQNRETKVSLEITAQPNNVLQNEPIKTKSEIELPQKNTIKEEKKNPPEGNTFPQDLPNMEPGSLMILSSLDENGEKVFKVYMVTPDKEHIPLDLSPDVVKSLTSSLGTDEEVTMDLPVIIDNS